MLSNIQGWIDVLSDVANILMFLIGLLALRRPSKHSRSSERKVRLRIGNIEWISIRKDDDHSL